MSFPKLEDRGKWHENVIIFDPSIGYLDYYKIHSDKFSNALKEYDAK